MIQSNGSAVSAVRVGRFIIGGGVLAQKLGITDYEIFAALLFMK